MLSTSSFTFWLIVDSKNNKFSCNAWAAVRLYWLRRSLIIVTYTLTHTATLTRSPIRYIYSNLWSSSIFHWSNMKIVFIRQAAFDLIRAIYVGIDIYERNIYVRAERIASNPSILCWAHMLSLSLSRSLDIGVIGTKHYELSGFMK